MLVADRGHGAGDLAELQAVEVERAELPDVGRVAHVAQEHDTRR